jgi:NAD(P)-dependent dehydrogenase (short-subunit alcohol dehydrogenase family)
LAEKTIIITGASDGIGAAAARKLVADGNTVVVVGRSERKTESVANELGAPYFVADFSDLSQVRELACQIQARYSRIDVLANNAGGIFGDRSRTRDGFEKTLQVNHLAPFLLTNLLLDLLVASNATVVNTSSSAARRWGNIHLDDLNNDMNYSARKAYGDSKLANILFTSELDRRFHNQGVSAVAFDPGIVASNFALGTNSWVRLVYHTPLKHLIGMITPEQGAMDLIWLAETAPGTDWTTGAFYAKHKIHGTNPQAADSVLASRLWDLSLEMVGLPTTSNPR